MQVISHNLSSKGTPTKTSTDVVLKSLYGAEYNNVRAITDIETEASYELTYMLQSQLLQTAAANRIQLAQDLFKTLVTTMGNSLNGVNGYNTKAAVSERLSSWQ